MRTQRQKENDRDRHAEQPQQDSASHDEVLSVARLQFANNIGAATPRQPAARRSSEGQYNPTARALCGCFQAHGKPTMALAVRNVRVALSAGGEHGSGTAKICDSC